MTRELRLSSNPQRRRDEMHAALLNALEAGEATRVRAIEAEYPEFAQEIQEICRLERELRPVMRVAVAVDWPERFPWAFGPYELLGRLGRGGMGGVFQARDSRCDRTVALKVPIATAPLDRERFRGEIRVAQKFREANILPVLESGELDGRPYFTMPLIEGGRSLQTLVEEGPQEARRAVTLMLPVVLAVGHLHVENILHRDLKPSNVLLRGDEPLVADFGLAKDFGSAVSLTLTGAVAGGTLVYMAPEQMRRRPHTRNSDIYGLGAILYALLTGRPPAEGATPLEVARHILLSDPQLITGVVDDGLAAVVLTCLDKHPGRRYERAGELAEDLRRWLAGDPVQARLPGPLLRLWRRQTREPRRLVLGGLALLPLVAFGVVHERRRARERQLERRAAEREREVHELQRKAEQEARRDLCEDALLSAATLAERFKNWGQMILLAAGPELRALLHAYHRATARARPIRTASARARQRLQRYADECARRALQPLANWQILDAKGRFIARTPSPWVGSSPFADRDYFQGAQQAHGSDATTAVHVSAAYSSRIDGVVKFGLSVPVLDDRKRLLGVLAVAVKTDPDLGISSIHRAGRKTVLIVPWDRNDPTLIGADGGATHVILSHEGLRSGNKPVLFDNKLLPRSFARRCGAELASTSVVREPEYLSRYLDPVAAVHPAYQGPWRAAIAPIVNTGHVVLVQQRR